jgi:PAS domain S-box-containing protein
MSGDDADQRSRSGDVQELRRALEESEERYRNLFENSVLGVYRTTPDGRVLMANPALLEMLGYSTLDELAGRDLEHGEFEPRYSRARFREKIETEGEIIGLESVWVKSDGTALFVRENARVVRSSAGVPMYYEGTVEDISERKRAEEKLRVLLAELSRVAERDRLRTAGKVTDLAVKVLGAAVGALRRGAPAGATSAIGDKVEQAARCVLIVHDEIDPPRLDETSLESAIASLVRRQQTVPGMEIELRDDQSPKPVEEDVGNLLLAAVRGLLLNVFVHSGAGRCVVELEKVGANISIAVTDDGAGFAPNALDCGFTPTLEGLRERLEATGGALEIDTAPGRGTKVVLLAPLSLAC